MRSTTTAPLQQAPIARAFDRHQNRITYDGWCLFVLGLSLFGSGFASTRFSVGGLLVHPYLFVVAALFPFVAAGRLRNIPPKLTMQMVLFGALYFVSTFAGGVAIGDGMKLAASIITILTTAMLVRSVGDFTMGVTGMAVAAGVLAYIGVNSSDVAGSGSVEAVQTGNRNAYSLYALPPILLGLYVLVRDNYKALFTKILLAASLFLASLAICLNTNRSGWLGLGLVILLIGYEKSIKALLIAAGVGVVVFVIITTAFGTKHLERRWEQTTKGNTSDDVRQELFLTSLTIGVENPLLGVSPQILHRELARRIKGVDSYLATHNVFAHLVGGCGLVCTALFFGIGYALWSWPSPPFQVYRERALFLEIRRITRFLLILYVVRGMFSAEILYAPAFNISLGLMLGMLILVTGTASSRVRFAGRMQARRAFA